MSTKREPLLSEYDRQNLWDDVVKPVVRRLERELGQVSPAFQAGEMGRAISGIYEAARSKDAELIHAAHTICEMIVSQTNDATAKMLCKDFLDLCKASGFKPNEP